MSTNLFVLSGIVLALVILAKIPGLEHTVRPLIDLIFSFITFLAENSLSWTIWFFKLMIDAHSEVIQNLILPAEKIDPTIAIKEQSTDPS